MTVGQLVEDLTCYGWPAGRKLTDDERRDIVSYAHSFEECRYGAAELEALSDQDLVSAAYCAMAEYASGQF